MPRTATTPRSAAPTADFAQMVDAFHATVDVTEYDLFGPHTE